VIGTPVPSPPWSGCDGGAIFVLLPAVRGRRRAPLFCRPVGVATKGRALVAEFGARRGDVRSSPSSPQALVAGGAR